MCEDVRYLFCIVQTESTVKINNKYTGQRYTERRISYVVIVLSISRGGRFM